MRDRPESRGRPRKNLGSNVQGRLPPKSELEIEGGVCSDVGCKVGSVAPKCAAEYAAECAAECAAQWVDAK